MIKVVPSEGVMQILDYETINISMEILPTSALCSHLTHKHILSQDSPWMLSWDFNYCAPSAQCLGYTPVVSVSVSNLHRCMAQHFLSASFSLWSNLSLCKSQAQCHPDLIDSLLLPLAACRLRQGSRLVQTRGQMWSVRGGQLPLSHREADAHQDPQKER